MLIPWSGGLDSTLTLYYALKYWYNRGNNSWIIYNKRKKFIASDMWMEPRTISIECNQIDKNQQIMQKKSRDRLIKFFNKKGWNFVHNEFNFDTSSIVGGINGQFCQPVIWLTLCSLFVRNEPVLMGWIRGDDASHYYDDYSQIWKSLTSVNGKESDLILPLFEYRKYHIIEECKKLNLLNKCWYCESPVNNKPCKKCDSCLTMMICLYYVIKLTYENILLDRINWNMLIWARISC